MGYGFVAPAEHTSLREGENQVLFRPHLIDALMRINGIDRASAEAAYGELAAISDNEAWLKVLRAIMPARWPAGDAADAAGDRFSRPRQQPVLRDASAAGEGRKHAQPDVWSM